VDALLRMTERPAHVGEEIGDDLVHFRLVNSHTRLDGSQHHRVETALIGGLDCFDFHRTEVKSRQSANSVLPLDRSLNT
jgi:hypothetical protein